eukprot:TRINITY_DN67628_c0_g1_i1.p1 TRINITY_DN67628_c0_g1~~TRINITY_DN67628_c0_g1_i1.p1  ORF type:complete len:298 (-),score=39.04 TRINITY_DN67628_c0_g1_i1:45-938(-)
MASPGCPANHPLVSKVAAGSWFRSCKTCSGCDAPLREGTVRHSCKKCNYHLCPSCHSAVGEAIKWSDISVTVYRAAYGGLDEDTLIVEIERNALIGALKGRISSLYGIPVGTQVLRRNTDGQPLADDEPLSCDDGDVVCLEVCSSANTMLTSQFGSVFAPLAGLTDALAGAMADAQQERLALEVSLEHAECALNFVMLASSASPSSVERRCRLDVAAKSFPGEVLEMVKLELGVEDQSLALEFAGRELAPGVPIYAAGLTGGDTVMVVPARSEQGAVGDLPSEQNHVAVNDPRVVSM